jgi:hypothetical protein
MSVEPQLPACVGEITVTFQPDGALLVPKSETYANEAQFRDHVYHVLMETMAQDEAMEDSRAQMEESFSAAQRDPEGEFVYARDIGPGGSHLVQDLRKRNRQLSFEDLEQRWEQWYEQQPDAKLARGAVWCFDHEAMIDNLRDAERVPLGQVIQWLQYIMSCRDCAVDIAVSDSKTGTRTVWTM